MGGDGGSAGLRRRGVAAAWVYLLVFASLSSCGDSHSPPGGSPSGTGGAAGQSSNAAPRWQWTVACLDGHQPATPIDYGTCAVNQALAEVRPSLSPAPSPSAPPFTVAAAGDPVVVGLAQTLDLASLLDPRPESYVVVPFDGTTWIVGRDDIGAMYGALEVAERLRLHGAAAFPPPAAIRGTPAIPIRGANLFWTIKDPAESTWWFLDESFWRQYLDLLAHARLNLLDLHAMYDPSTTVFPNAMLYLARSASFPDAGVPQADRDANVAMFNKVVALAHARGIRVALMTYQATTSVDGFSGEVLDDASLKTYDREAAADIATRIPGLDMLGFRIGESGRDATWYIDSVVAGARQARPDMALYTRTWGASKDEILKLAAAFGPNNIVEAKYNGEQLGAPYAIAGGNFTYYGGYSYQSFLTPPDPWSFVFQVRAAGTHRIFRQASYLRSRRAVVSLGELSPDIRGFTLEPPHAFAPQRDVYHAHDEDRLAPWTFVRDDLMYLLWGRLGYDPGTPESTFRAIAAREIGADTLWEAIQAASDIVPWIQTAHTCGPDHRSFEPEMELGGDVAQWAGAKPGPDSCGSPGPFDTFAVAGVNEVAADLVAGVPTSRVSPVDVAARVLDDAATIDAALQAAGSSSSSRDDLLARDLIRECRALADLGRHFAHKLRAATALAVYTRTATPAWIAAARAETQIADDAWRSLADDTAYIAPVLDRLRMAPLGYDPFHWSKLVPALGEDAKALDQIAAQVGAAPPPPARALPDPAVWLGASRPPGPGLTTLSVSPALAGAATWTVQARFASPVPASAAINVLWKAFDSERSWASVPASRSPDGSYTASISGEASGALFAVEISAGQGAWRYPDAMSATPYVSLAPSTAGP